MMVIDINFLLQPHLSPCLFLDPPEIDVERAWIHTGENQEAILACIVHADPPALVSNS